MKEETKVSYLNPIEMINNYFQSGIFSFDEVDISQLPKSIGLGHINFDKDVIPEYHIIRESTHDGTIIFTSQLIAEALEPLIRMESYYKVSAPEDLSTIKGINYTIGEIELKSVYGMKDLKCGRYPGVTNIVSIPVRCEYILK